jgi:hypothetical protein
MHRVSACNGTSEPSRAITLPCTMVRACWAGFGGILDERVGVFAGAQRVVWFVAAIGKGFRTDASQDPTDVVFGALEHKQAWRCQQLLLLKQQGAGRVPVDAFQSNLVARAKLSDAVQVSGNHVRNLRIASGGLLFHKQDDRQASGGNLDGAKRNAFGNHFAVGSLRYRRTFEAETHAIGLFRDAIRAVVEQLLRWLWKPITLRTGSDAQDLAR